MVFEASRRAGLSHSCRWQPLSVPFRSANEPVNAKLTATTAHLAHQGKIIATHIRTSETGKLITNPDHMPPAHQQVSMMWLSGMKAYARDINPHAERLIDEHFRINEKPDVTANTAMKLRALTDQYSADRIEAACGRAITVGKRSAVRSDIKRPWSLLLRNAPHRMQGWPRCLMLRYLNYCMSYGLSGFEKNWEHQLQHPQYSDMPIQDRILHMLQAETERRYRNKIDRLMKATNFQISSRS